MALNTTTEYRPEALFTGTTPVLSEPEVYAAGVDVARLTVVGRVAATGKLKKAVKTATDGSQKPIGIAVADVECAAADVIGPTYKAGAFNPDVLAIDPTFTVEEVRLAFEGTPITMRRPLNLTTW